MRMPIVLPYPNHKPLFEDDDVLVIFRHTSPADETSRFLGIMRVREIQAPVAVQSQDTASDVVRSYLTASRDAVLCYAIEFAQSQGIDRIYDATQRTQVRSAFE